MSYKFLTVNNKLLRKGKKYLYYDPDAFEWYTLTEDDCTYLAQSAWNRTIIQSITTTEENIVIPSTLAGYPTYFDINIPSSVKRIKFDEGTYNRVSVKASNNSTLIGIYNVPPILYQLSLTNCTALRFIELENVTNVSSIRQITGCTALQSLSEVSAEYNGTALSKLWFSNRSGDIRSFTVPSAVTDMSFALYQNGITDFIIDSSWDHLENCSQALNKNPLSRLTITSNNFGDLSVLGGRTSGAYQSDIDTAASSITFVVNYLSAMYNTIRYIQSTEDYACRNLRLEMLDHTPIKNISFWGDSLTRRNEVSTSHGYMVEQFHDYTDTDVMSWNYGRGGATTRSYATYFNAQPQRYGDVSVMWLGTNDTGIGGSETVQNIKGYLSQLTGDYIVVMPWGWGYDSDNINAFNAAGWGDKLLNVHDYVVQHGFDILGKTPTSAEQEQLNNDEIPDIYVDTSDHTHLTRFGGQVISTAIKERLLALGYITNDWLSLEGKNTSVTISATILSVPSGSTRTLTSTSGNGGAITWSSTDETIATVSNGTVTGVASGSCYVIARCGSYSKFCTVTVS